MNAQRRVSHALLTFALVATPAAAQRLQPDNGVPHISVSSTATVFRSPDVARVLVVITHTRETAREASEQTAAIADAVIETIAGVGIPRDSIITVSYRIDPRYDNVRPGARRITGYVARTELAVSVRDLTRIGAVLDAALRGGATEITQISYRLNDATEAREEAYRKAVTEIRSNAATIAEAAGGRLGSIISIGTSQVPVQQPRVALGMAAQAPTIQPGEISVSVNVNARFEFIEND